VLVRRIMTDPTRVLPIVMLVSLPTVMYGGHALLRYVTKGGLSELRQQMFRAGHAHAGVLLILALVYDVYLARTNFSNPVRGLLNGVLGIGVLAQCGGFFIHMAVGEPGKSSIGTMVTRGGALLLAAAMLALAYGLATA
jgi:hypothetical protein